MIEFEGMKTGKVDDNGIEIRCGDRVSLYEFKEGYLETHAQDGWGRDVALCRHDQRRIPDREKTTEGTVVYKPEAARFVVSFDGYLLESGHKEKDLSTLGMSTNYQKERLFVMGNDNEKT